MKSLGHELQPENWCLFIDENKHSSKAVLLHNENEYSSKPIDYAITMEDCSVVMEFLLDEINYKSYE